MTTSAPKTEPVLAAPPGPDADTVESNHDLCNSRPIAPRSCNTCNLKKVRCDRKHPCSRCTRNGKNCVYPPIGPRIRRSKKTIMAEMASRLSNLEKSVSSTVDTKHMRTPETDTETQHATLPATSSQRSKSTEETTKTASVEDILVQRGSSSQYFNDILLSKMIGEERTIESALTTPTPSPEEESMSPFNALGILSALNPMQPPYVFHPSKPLAQKLWQFYANDEDSCISTKILHRPTAEITVFAVIENPMAAPHDHLALCFAIYFSAMVFLQEADTESVLLSERRCHLLNFKNGIEQAFAYGDFLDCPSVIGLQALAIYLSALRIHNRGKAMWVLNGLALRIAQSLGLHRDGQHLGLLPFDSEVRRRLWWVLVVRDGRAAEDYGLRDNSIVSFSTDAKYPLNLEDSDLYPGMKTLPPSRDSWTPMMWSLLHIELFESMRELEAAGVSHYSEDTRRRVMDDLKEKMEKRIKCCNPVIPRQQFGISCGRFVLRKLDFTTRQRWFMLQNPGSHNKFATEENLAEALDIIDAGFFTEKNEMLSQYTWTRKAYPQYHMALYVLWHLHLRPEGPNVERAWDAIKHIFSSLENSEMQDQGFGSKAIILKVLKAKAEAAGRKIQTREATSQVHQTMTPSEPSPGYFPLGNPGDGWANYSLLGFELQDWTTWTQGT